MKKALGVLFKLLATGAVSLFIAACYGVPMVWKRIVAHSLDEDKAIMGLQVTLFEAQTARETEMTDEQGAVVFVIPGYRPRGIRASIEDVDGPDNGGDFRTKEIAIGPEEEYLVHLARK